MPTFTVKSRTKGPVEVTTIDAATRDEAIAKTIEAAEEGAEVEVMQVMEGTLEEEEAAPKK